MATFQKRGATWRYIIDTKDEYNQRKQITKGGFKTKKEAQHEAAKIQQQIDNGEYYEVVKMSVGEFVAEWLNNYARFNLKEKTYTNRKHMLNARILPAIGKIKIDALKPLTIQKMYQSFLADGLSPNYVNTIHRLLFNIFKYAVKWRVIKFNPMDGVDAPKIRKKSVTTWDFKQIQTFLASNRKAQYYIAFSLALYTGMRRGEIINLKWEYVNFDKKIITVIAGKTSSSIRSIAMPDVLIKDLKAHKAKQNERKLEIGDAYQDYNYVVATSLGSKLLERNLIRAYHAALNHCPDLPRIRFHDLRHSHATLLLAMGENPKIVSERLGHSRINVTLDLYSHVLPEMQQATAKKIDDVFNAR